MTVGRSRRAVSTVAIASTLAGGLVFVGTAPAFAEPGGVVISELNYHAVSDLDGDDFIELANTSDAPIDMSGWAFSAGITGVFPAGTVIPAGGRFVAGKDAVQFQATYGFAPDFVYGGNLSNGGEQVSLSTADPVANPTAVLIDTVTYADVAPWPGSPDAQGPSLELRDLMSDNTVAENWGPSTGTGGTPKAKNSLEGSSAPGTISDVAASPQRPAPNQAVQVTAKLPTGATATLKYKVMFGADVSVPFVDDLASPGGANDGVYAASIPGQAAGSLIRYRIEATAGGQPVSFPVAGDTINYKGVVVTNPAASTELPTIEWFMEDSVYEDLRANHREDDVQGAAVWSYNGEVIDNVLMNIRGGTSRTLDKNNWKVELPKGYEWTMGGALPYPLDEFALQNYVNPYADMAWQTVDEAGARGLTILPVRTQRNGSFWSLGRIMETEDGAWRDAQGVDDWAIYKGDGGAVGRSTSAATLAASGWLDKKTREDEDFTDVWTLSNTVDAAPSAAQQAWIYQNVNVPELINYMAINSITRHYDSGWHNWWLARDTEGTGRWEMWHWDLDLTFGPPSADGKGTFLTPDSGNNFTEAMLAYPEFREMFHRRLRTLADQFLPVGEYEALHDTIRDRTLQEWRLDNTAWGTRNSFYTPERSRARLLEGLTDRRNVINSNTAPNGPVPTSQSADAAVVINEIMYSSANASGDWLELANPSNTAVDISGWTISDGINLTVQAGTVIPANSRMVFVEDDAAFRAAYPAGNRLVGGEFGGGLSANGETLTLKAGDRVVDAVTYGAAAPWPAATGGPSLELVSPTADNADPANWRATAGANGTPGLANAGATPNNPAPTASFTNTVSGLQVSVDGSASSDTNGTIASHSWNWGDNTAAGTGATATHTYATAGTYTVTLTVTDNGGATATSTASVTVGGTTPPPTGTLAADTFGRTSTNSLGTAEVGGAWTVTGTSSNYAVNNGTAKFTTAAGSERIGYLNGVSSTSTDLRLSASFTRPSSGTAYLGVYGRRIGSDHYRARATVNASGAVALQLQRGTTTLRSGTVTGLTFNTGDTLQFRVQVTGTNPTTFQAKVWKAGGTEPANWTLTTTDTTAALQAAGSIGLYSYYSSGSTPSPLVVSWDNLSASSVGGGTPTNTPPQASFTSTANGLTASFNGSGSTDADGTIASYAWQFGDGTTGTGATPSHAYATAGTYPVTLTVTDNGGATHSVSRQVTVASTPPANAAPTASFTTTVAGLGVNVNGSGSTDSDGTIASYSWNWGDNTAAGTGATATHTYAAAGTYTVTLTVTDNGGATATTTRQVTVTSAPPAGGPLAADTFGRTATNSLGTAETGGAWTVSGTASNYSVNGGTGKFSTAAGAERIAYLNSVSSNSTDLRVSAAFNRQTTGTVYLGVYGRRVGTEFYRARVVVSASGAATLQLQRGTTTLRSITIPNVSFATGDTLQLRLQVTGTNPTTIQAKVWEGATEPTAWTLTTTDTTAALQTAGSIGLYSYYSSGSTPSPVVVNWDNLTASRVQ
ncbi:PKD domain-containing protein [Naasia sp. SYSU D00057]|uniref:PKD domain-containing protein n=1 Tax=Naasia sp. SYSU D00057 TaxID=2817380 RepID=UPI001B317027|nr:PKD domain-containing protein [Naasia sp. SYSU D00057]